nr:class F sortase [Propionibacterium sp.]
MSLSRPRRVVAAAAAATLAGALTFATVGGAGDPASALSAVGPTLAAGTATPTPTPEPTPSTEATTPPSPRPTSTIPTRDAAPAAAQPAATAVPTRLRIPRLDASLPVSPVGLDADGAMELPASPSAAGWYRFGPSPGTPGATVIAAHVDAPGEGRGPLAGLVRLKAGDAVEVDAGGATLRYRVVEVLRIDKGELDVDAVFSRAGDERLHVVSCGGVFNRATRHYEDNVIAIAVPVR